MKRPTNAGDKIEVEGVEIRKGIPRPPPKNDKIKWTTIFNGMEPGDSFMLRKGLEKKCRAAARAYSHQYGGEFEVVRTDEGWGCWRIK
jgi:hypothetical protein